MSYWTEGVSIEGGLDGWKQSVKLACEWMIDRSMIKTERLDLPGSGFKHLESFTDWRGAFLGEYSARTRTWDVFCPVWHGGQGLKALVLAYELLGEARLLEHARLTADFIVRHQVTDTGDRNCGLILAYEAGSDGINTSAIMEGLEGLFAFARVTGETCYADAAIAALRWVQKTMFMPEQGLFHDDFDVAEGTFRSAAWMLDDRFPQPGRPLLDDGVFLTGHRLCGDDAFKDIAVRVADRLLADEDPEGNWKAYPPCYPDTGVIHPRQAFWWGRPMWMVHQATGDRKYLDCCRRSAQWYVRAMRSDGGMFRNTGPDFNTPSFGHATSGIACGAILWTDLVREYGDEQWREPIQRALKFCRSVQFTQAADQNLQGAILEKVLAPNGSDAPTWYLREVGTFFYVQAVCGVMQAAPELLASGSG